jgi:hypothetical protein
MDGTCNFPIFKDMSTLLHFLCFFRDWVMMDWVDSLVWPKQLEQFQMDYLPQDLH